MGQSGVKALPSPRSFKPLWSSDGKINTTRGKRGLELPPIRQGISSGASAVSNDGLQNHGISKSKQAYGESGSPNFLFCIFGAISGGTVDPPHVPQT